MIINDSIAYKKLEHLYNLKNIVRYSMRYKITNESVAEHSYFVALFTMFICDELKMSLEAKQKCIAYALCHDLPEIKTGDLPHPVKAASIPLRDALTQLEFDFVDKYLPTYADDYKRITIPSDQASDVYELYNAIVSLADIVSVIQYVYLEISMGNNTFEDILTNATKRYMIELSRIEKLTGVRIKYFEEKNCAN